MLVNLALTLTVMTLLVQGSIEPATIFFAAVGIALVVNFHRVGAQADQITAHASSVVGVVGLVFAATVLICILSGSGMVEAIAVWLVNFMGVVGRDGGGLTGRPAPGPVESDRRVVPAARRTGQG